MRLVVRPFFKSFLPVRRMVPNCPKMADSVVVFPIGTTFDKANVAMIFSNLAATV